MMAAGSLSLIVALVAVALIFDFLNGLHDAANSIATVVSTRVLSPTIAVAWAAFFNLIAFSFFGLHVAQTIGTGIISPDIVDWRVIFGALMGAITWNLITWWAAIPSSSSHALIGGLVGAGTAKGGVSAVVWPGIIKTVSAILWSPLLGFGVALFLWLILAWLLMRSTPFAVDRKFRMLQLGSAALYSIGHGANDAQKTMSTRAWPHSNRTPQTLVLSPAVSPPNHPQDQGNNPTHIPKAKSRRMPAIILIICPSQQKGMRL